MYYKFDFFLDTPHCLSLYAMLSREDIFIIPGLYMYISTFDSSCSTKIAEASVDIDSITGLSMEIKPTYLHRRLLTIDDVRGQRTVSVKLFDNVHCLIAICETVATPNHTDGCTATRWHCLHRYSVYSTYVT